MTEPRLAGTTAGSELFDAIVFSRRSTRGFRSDPLPPHLLEHVFTLAGRAPSNCNVQPWITHVASGAALDRIRAALTADAEAGRINPDVPLTSAYEDVYRARRNASAKALFEATGVGRQDMEARRASFLRNFVCFDAPHAAFIFMPSDFGLREACDVGMFAQTLMLALTAHGAASCAQGALSHHATALRELLGVEARLVCLFGISFGYADDSHPSASVRTGRAHSETVVFHH